MFGEIAQLIECPPGAATPLLVSRTRSRSRLVALVAAHSEAVAQQIAEGLLDRVPEDAPGSAIADLLRTLDGQVGPSASASVGVVVITRHRVAGAVAGRVQALLVGDPDVELAAGHAPGVGSGRVQPVAFAATRAGQLLVLGTSEAFARAGTETVFAAAREASPGRAVARLAEFARDTAGELSAPLAIIAHRAAVEAAPVADAGRPRVLFAEAHAGFVHSVTKSVLKDFDVVAKGRVADALDAAAEARFDVALVDYDLPDDKGDVLIRALRDRGFSAPIIAVSAKDSANATLVAAGANAACSKLAFGQILDVIRGALGVH